MYRFIIVLTVAAIGVLLGVLVGLIGGVAFLEFGNNSCTGVNCADVVARTFIPVAAGIGGLLGISKGYNLITAKVQLV